MKKSISILLIIAVLTATSLACNLTQRLFATPKPTIPVTTESAQSLESTLENAYEQGQQTGEINFSVTEEQLTSMVALQLSQLSEQPFQNPQVYLQNGQIQVTGKVSTQGIQAPAKIVGTVTVDSSGIPSLHVTSATVGPFSIPSSIINNLETQFNQIFLMQIYQMYPNLFVEQVTIENGVMSIQGHTR
jgi:uncharacterized protein YpmS